MTEEKASMKRKGSLKDLVRKELGSDTNRRFLGRMKAFKLDGDIPDQFKSLLGELDQAENARSSR
ncbi:hypothetical protein [Mesorhizobium sp. CAU 1741]|uniref:hypothetical protein n=1 Tax=Mesorhizobium sp. CAU 1741 TaxID=3140366 RepID=UPI00325A4FA7